MILYMGVLPGAALVSVRLVNGSWTAAFSAALLVLGVSRYFFLWLLHYGTAAAISPRRY